MAKIRGKNTKPELALRKALSEAGVRYRLHSRGVPGTPDICHQAARVAVFIDGCFWHGCPKHYTAPRTRRAYWQAKVKRNIARRKEVREELGGWQVFEVFTCELKSHRKLASKIARTIRRRRTN